MDQEKDDLIWQQLSKRLFRARKTTDERIFSARVIDGGTSTPASQWFLALVCPLGPCRLWLWPWPA